MQATELAAMLCARFEGFYRYPYLCPAGVPTIGYGTTRYPNGCAVTLLDAPITKGTALLYLQHDLRIAAASVGKLCPVGMTEARRAALIDFAYNCGTGALRASTLRRRVNAGDWERAKLELMKWTKGGGHVLRGLVLRRRAESALM